MSNTPNPKTQSGGDSVRLAQAETDAFLETVSQQLDQKTFDANNHQILKRMVEGLGDSRGMVRLSFAEALGEIGQPATPFLLEALANHSNPVVRRASGKTLTLIADPIAIPTLIHSLLNDEDTVVKGSVVGALARTGEAAVPALLEILASTEYPESAKGHAAWALAFIGTEAKEHVYRALASDSPEVRAAVVGVIFKVAQEDSDEQACQLLINALSDTAENVRCEAASALGNLTYRPAVPSLIELLHHVDGESRKAAALSLMKIGDRVALKPLETALTQEREASVQQVLKLAISQLERQSEEEDIWE